MSSCLTSEMFMLYTLLPSAWKKEVREMLTAATMKGVQMMRRAGLPIDVLARCVKLNLAGEETLPQRIELLKTQRLELERQRQEIDEAMTILNRKIKKYEEVLKNNT